MCDGKCWNMDNFSGDFRSLTKNRKLIQFVSRFEILLFLLPKGLRRFQNPKKVYFYLNVSTNGDCQRAQMSLQQLFQLNNGAVIRESLNFELTAFLHWNNIIYKLPLEYFGLIHARVYYNWNLILKISSKPSTLIRNSHTTWGDKIKLTLPEIRTISTEISSWKLSNLSSYYMVFHFLKFFRKSFTCSLERGIYLG